MEKERILIVDDEMTSRKMLGIALAGDNRELIYAEDGESAVRAAKEHKPRLIVMDILLPPPLDGLEATRLIKSAAETRHIPVVLITARSAKYDEKVAAQAGCDDYITKPFRVGSLRKRLAKYLG